MLFYSQHISVLKSRVLILALTAAVAEADTIGFQRVEVSASGIVQAGSPSMYINASGDFSLNLPLAGTLSLGQSMDIPLTQLVNFRLCGLAFTLLPRPSNPADFTTVSIGSSDLTSFSATISESPRPDGGKEPLCVSSGARLELNPKSASLAGALFREWLRRGWS